MVPFAVMKQDNEELETVEKNGAYQKGKYSKWEATIVFYIKEDNKIRLWAVFSFHWGKWMTTSVLADLNDGRACPRN